MLLPELNLNSIEEFKNFSLKEIFRKEYDVKIGGDLNTKVLDKTFEDFLIINTINGVPVSDDLPQDIEIKKCDVCDIESYNPLLNLNNKYQNIIYDIIFKRCPTKPIVIINYITAHEVFIPGNLRFTVENDGIIDLLEITHQATTGEGFFMNNRREFNIKNTVLNYSRVDNINNNSSVIYNYYGYIDNGTLNSVNLNNSGYFNMNNWDIDLITKNSNCYVSGIIKLKDKMRHGSICKISHLAEYSKSSQEFRHVLDDECYAMYDGDSTVLTIAKYSSTSQKSRTIMLSDKARILNKPRLNIYTGEVKATHGASVGKLNDDDIFYLKQRGLPDRVIKKLLVDAFVVDILDNIGSDKIRGYLYDKR